MNEDDPLHKAAIGYYKKIVADGYSLLLTNFIIAETHVLLLKNTHSIAVGLQWLDEVAYKAFNVVRPSEYDETQSIHILKKYHDKAWSFTDALSFQVMERLHIKYYFSFDNDFRQIGKFMDITHYLAIT
jgi:predicted nucleic acid-binding protein